MLSSRILPLLFLAASAARAQQPALPSPSSVLEAAREAGPAPAVEGRPVAAVGSYRFLQSMGNFPPGLAVADVESLLRRFAEAAYGKGFRWLGDANDADHGHFLYRPGRYERPFAVLFHTQEHASKHSVADPGGKYDYLDRGARNWILWLDTGLVENAAAYERSEYPEGKRWDKYRAWNADPKKTVGNEKFTIHAFMLDPKKVPYDFGRWSFDTPGTGRTGQFMFTFRRTECASLPDPLPADHNVVRVALPAQDGMPGGAVCLLLG